MSPDRRTTVGFMFGLSLGIGLLCALVYRANRHADFVSCRNHASFVARTADQHIRTHGWLPHVPGVPGEELFCRLDFQGYSQACNETASEQGHGGWQMVNASREAWSAILEEMHGELIPVIWCGRPHPYSGRGGPRIVVGIDGTREEDSLTKIQQRYLADDVFRLVYQGSIEYGMPEDELVGKVDRMNRILAEQGEPPIEVDIEGGRDYVELALPFQTERR